MTLEVKVVGPDQRDAGTGQTPGGLHRFAAVSDKLTGSERMWMGYATLDPGGRTGVHHHGDSESAIYIVSGIARWWVGDRLDEPREAHPGDFVFIPPHAVHWEENAGEDPVEMIVARSSQDAIVVAVDDHPHAPAHHR